jgi:transcriptional regulator with XRE-family HTH domain
MPEGILMDQVKIGKFIAELRRWAGLTQEALGEKIGVTNKTISRWENGDYMPNIEMLQLLAEEFSISISEILAGEKFSDEESRHKADENAIATTSTSTFSLKERKSFFKKKWRREHFSLFAVLALILIAAVVFPLVFHKPWLLGIAPLVALVEYGFQNNRMMVYVEKCLYK